MTSVAATGSKGTIRPMGRSGKLRCGHPELNARRLLGAASIHRRCDFTRLVGLPTSTASETTIRASPPSQRPLQNSGYTDNRPYISDDPRCRPECQVSGGLVSPTWRPSPWRQRAECCGATVSVGAPRVHVRISSLRPRSWWQLDGWLCVGFGPGGPQAQRPILPRPRLTETMSGLYLLVIASTRTYMRTNGEEAWAASAAVLSTVGNRRSSAAPLRDRRHHLPSLNLRGGYISVPRHADASRKLNSGGLRTRILRDGFGQPARSAGPSMLPVAAAWEITLTSPAKDALRRSFAAPRRGQQRQKEERVHGK